MKLTIFVISVSICAFGATAQQPQCSRAGNEFLAHPTDPSKYYKCVFGDRLPRDCPAGTYFNLSAESCLKKSTAAEPIKESPPVPSKVECSHSGNEFLAHPTDPSKYYKCVFGDRIPRDCPAGTYFNLSAESCLKKSTAAEPIKESPPVPSKVECSHSGNEFLAHPTDPSKYYKCVFGDRIPRDCPAGTFFNLKAESCLQKSTTAEPIKQTPVAEPVKESPQASSKVECSHSGNEFLAHPTDPSKYYKCVFGDRLPRDCPAGTYFNLKAESCLQKSTAAEPTKQTPVAEPVKESPQASSKVECSHSGNEFLAHPTDPSKYYKCVFGDRLPRDCPAGTFFNLKSESCLQKSNTAEPIKETPVAEPVKESPQVSSKVECSHSGNEFLAHPTDPSKYYKCVFGDRLPRDCPAGTYFNLKSESCIQKSTAAEPTKQTPVAEPVKESPQASSKVECSHSGNEFLAHPTDPSKYYKCVFGDRLPRDCPAGTFFNLKSESCLQKSNTAEPIKETPVAEPVKESPQVSSKVECSHSGNEFLAHPTDPSKYYKCVFGDRLPRDCPAGTFFNLKSESCLQKSNTAEPIKETPVAEPVKESPQVSSKVECSHSGNEFLAHPTDPSKYYKCVFGDRLPRDCPAGTYFNLKAESCLQKSAADEPIKETPVAKPVTGSSPAPSKVECSYSGNEFLAHPTDPSKYYKCVFGDRLPRDCPAGTFFNLKAEACLQKSTAAEPIKETPVTEPVKESPQASSKVECSHSGNEFLAHPTDPSKYYKCVFGDRLPRDCPAGTYFNLKSESCLQKSTAAEPIKETPVTEPVKESPLAPSKVECSHSGNEFLAHPTDPSKYYKCVFGDRLPRNCPAGTFFNLKAESCLKKSTNAEPIKETTVAEPVKESSPAPSKVECSHSGNEFLAHPTDPSKYYKCVFGDRLPRDCPAGTFFNLKAESCLQKSAADEPIKEIPVAKPVTESPPAPSKVECSHSGNEFLAHPTDPSKYYKCVFGDRLPRNCPAGTFFNLKAEACLQKSTAAEPIKETPVAEPVKESPPAPSKVECSHSGNEFLAHPTDPSKYYKCVFGDRLPRDCPAGTFFNLKAESCLQKSTTAEPIKETPVAEPVKESPPAPSKVECSHSGNEFLAHPTDPSKYYKCVFGDRLPRDCPAGTYFNLKAESCLQKSAADEPIKETPVAETVKESPPAPSKVECSHSGNEFLAHPTDPSKYYKCVFGDRLPRDCPAGTFFNLKAEACLQKSTATEPIKETPVAEPVKESPPAPSKVECSRSGNEFLAHPTDCSKYYKCVYGDRLERSCPTDEYFHLDSALCVPKNFIKCNH